MKYGRVGLSPAIPTVAVLLLAALWGLSAYAGWGLEAFCADDESSRSCAERLETVASFSGLFAVVGAGCAAVAWLIPAPRGFMPLMGTAIAAWVVAEAVLFAGGMLVR
ncbi:hypothetical protein HNP84_009266 [Thermocatellispora tengchongensis]|uniref:Uncharacterized protein n=1 Tax=Thermocatellispora tengchongensis TaxID=1073253 RepID=A0A840PNA0_9ACTN|nr:hypothetical protein [Thermocatellispora tengchongensis]MBB5139503.1 hypothetical protein [Thermocatellispora tengchongensis]